MNDLRATGKPDFIGDDLAVNGRATGSAKSALVSHYDPSDTRLTIDGNVIPGPFDVEQDIIPSQTTGQNDLRLRGQRKILAHVDHKVITGTAVQSQDGFTSQNDVGQVQHRHRTLRVKRHARRDLGYS